jgi:hypothetical protein
MRGAGAEVASLSVDDVEPGMNRVIWDLRHTATDDFGDSGSRGPFVVPGTYTVSLDAGGVPTTQTVEVREDPRLDHDTTVRRAWTETLLEIWDANGRARALRGDAEAYSERLDSETDPLSLDTDLEAELRGLARETQELSSRLGRLYGSAQAWVGPLAADQAAQQAFLSTMLDSLTGDWEALAARLPG